MRKTTTDDCKKYLVQTFNDKDTKTLDKDWKRTKKYKDDNGLWIRDFNHPVIGDISLFEDENGILSINGTSVVNSLNNKQDLISKFFDLTIFSDIQIKEAWKAYKDYYKDDTDTDHFVVTHDKSIRLIPSILSWYVDGEAYENYELKPKKITWNFNMKGFNIYMFDHQNHHEYGGDEHLLKKYLPPYLSKCDEYHYEVETDITLEQLVLDLSAFGYSHVNSYVGKKCVLSNLMKTATFNKVSFSISQLEQDILSDNIKNYSIDKLNEQKINNQSVPFFAFENNKIDLFDYLVENNIHISNEDFSSIISMNYFNFDKEPHKFDTITKVALKYENIEINNDDLHNLVFNLIQKNKNIELFSLFNKYFNDSNAFVFAQSETLIKDENVVCRLISRFSKHDDDLTHWLNRTFIYEEKIDLLSSEKIRNALTKDYITSILNDIHNQHIDALKSESDREKSGMFIVEISQNGSRETWGFQRAKQLAKFIVTKNKILSCFDENDDDDTPKIRYKTKF